MQDGFLLVVSLLVNEVLSNEMLGNEALDSNEALDNHGMGQATKGRKLRVLTLIWAAEYVGQWCRAELFCS